MVNDISFNFSKRDIMCFDICKDQSTRLEGVSFRWTTV